MRFAIQLRSWSRSDLASLPTLADLRQAECYSDLIQTIAHLAADVGAAVSNGRPLNVSIREAMYDVEGVVWFKNWSMGCH